MAIKRGSKVEVNGSSASMTDLMFLLLIFLMIATTMINTNALKLQLPKSSNIVSDKTPVIVSITPDIVYYVDNTVVSINALEGVLQSKLKDVASPIISLQSDQSVPVGEVVKVMNIAKRNKYQLNLATSAE